MPNPLAYGVCRGGGEGGLTHCWGMGWGGWGGGVGTWTTPPPPRFANSDNVDALVNGRKAQVSLPEKCISCFQA